MHMKASLNDGHVFSVDTLYLEAVFFSLTSWLCSALSLLPLLSSECIKEQVSTAPWGPVTESSDERTRCQYLIKNATENTYVIKSLMLTLHLTYMIWGKGTLACHMDKNKQNSSHLYLDGFHLYVWPLQILGVEKFALHSETSRCQSTKRLVWPQH